MFLENMGNRLRIDNKNTEAEKWACPVVSRERDIVSEMRLMKKSADAVQPKTCYQPNYG
jgi:hypothetical protein